MKYQRLKLSSCKDVGIRTSQFEASFHLFVTKGTVKIFYRVDMMVKMEIANHYLIREETNLYFYYRNLLPSSSSLPKPLIPVQLYSRQHRLPHIVVWILDTQRYKVLWILDTQTYIVVWILDTKTYIFVWILDTQTYISCMDSRYTNLHSCMDSRYTNIQNCMHS